MKKSIFILAALFAATISNAQIVKEWSGPIEQLGTGMQAIEAENGLQLIGHYFLTYRESQPVSYDIIDATTLKIAKSFTINETGWENFFGIDWEKGETTSFISKGVFSTDGKWACLVLVPTAEGTIEGGASAGMTYHIYTEAQVRNEDGTVLATIPYYNENYGNLRGAKIKLVKAGNTLKLYVPQNDKDNLSQYIENWDIYSLPGDGSTQDFVSVTSPNNIPSRKIIQNDQVLVESNNQTFNMQGQRVK
jgi:hypothetical protein